MLEEEVAQLAGDLARDEAGILTADERARALAAALARYSADVPRFVTGRVRFDADGFAPVPRAWTDGAWIREARSAGAEIDCVVVIAGPQGKARLLTASGVKGATVTFAAPHSWASVPEVHALPVAQFAASILCEQLAIFYSAQREQTLTGAASLTEQRASMYARRAEELRAAYFAGIGRIDPMKDAAGAAAGGAAWGSVACAPINPRHALTGRLAPSTAAARFAVGGATTNPGGGMATSASYTKAESDARYALKTQLADYAKKSELPSTDVFVSRGEVNAALKSKADESTVQTVRRAVSQNTTAIAGLTASKADASALESYAKKTDIPAVPDLSDYAKKSDIPAAPDLSDYAKKSDIPAAPDLSDYAKKSDIPAAPDLSDYAKKSEVPSAETVSSLSETVANQGRGLAALQTSKADASAIADMATKAWVQQFINELDASDKEY